MNKMKIKKSVPAEVRKFHSTAEKFLEESHELFPHEASELGLEKFESKLARNDAGIHRHYTELLRSTLGIIETFPETVFTGDDWLDRRGFLSMLRTNLLFNETFERWRTNPQEHCDAAIQSIFGLVIRHAKNLPRALPKIESRLAKLPDFLGEGASCIRKPVPLWTRLAIKTCNGAEQFLTELEKTAVPLSPDENKTRRLFHNARAAFRDYANTIQNKTPGSPNGFCIGRESFEYLIRERLGLSWSLPEAEAMGWKLIAELREAVKTEAAKFGGGKKSATEIIESAAAGWTLGTDSLVDEYGRVTAKVRAAVSDADLLTLPEGEKLNVLLVPEFLRHQFPTAAYHSPGPFAKDQTGIFWVNDLSQQQTDPKKRRAEIRQHFGLELTCAHEGYPGHHVQFVIQNRHPSKLRRLFAHAIFYEGWTLWCEKMCIDFQIYDAPHARLMQLYDALWRAHRIVIDCGLHSGKLTHRTASDLLVSGVGFTRQRAEGDVNWYTSAPTVPMSYLLGRLELEKLYRRLVLKPSGEDAWTVKRFNDWILSFGAIPWSWIWQAQLNQPGAN
jgi:hypothetical protein